jgi:hypothetical protein
MMPFNGSVSSAHGIRVADLRAYLLSNGWKVRPFKRPQVIYFEGPPGDDGRPLVLLVPASEHLRDYLFRVEEILRTLSILENRSLSEVVRNILMPTADILHLRLESPETRTGTLELRFVEHFFSAMKDMLVFAACGQFEPKPFYPRALKQAIQFADKCRYRPAPAGSFRVDVEAPLSPPADEVQVRLGDYPIERLVLTSLMQGLGELQTAIDSGQTSSLLAKPPRRINANLCEAIAGMRPDTTDVTWEVSISWSAAWPVDDSSLPQSVRFQDRSFEQIDAIGRALRSGNRPRPGQIRGKIIRLSGKDPLRGGSGPLSVLLATETPGAQPNVEIVLNTEQYRRAGEAHLHDNRVAVRGILDRVGRRWHVLDVSDFEVLREAAFEN